MKKLFFIILFIAFTAPAYAGENGSAVRLPVKAKIVNLTQMSIEDAITFCNERNLTCDALRKKFRAQKSKRLTENVKSKTVHEDTGRVLISNSRYINQ